MVKNNNSLFIQHLESCARLFYDRSVVDSGDHVTCARHVLMAWSYRAIQLGPTSDFAH